MGGNRIKNLKDIIDAIFIALKSKEFEKLSSLSKKLQEIDLQTLNEEDRKYFYNALDEIEKIVQKSKDEILKNIQDKESLKKFRM